MSVISDLMNKFTYKMKKKQYELGVSDGYKKRVSEEQENRLNVKLSELSLLEGKPIIALINEWQEPIVGKIVNINCEKGIVFTFFDYIRNEERVSLSYPMAFSEQRLEIFGKLNPDEICALYFEGKYSHHTYRKLKNYGKEFDFPFTNIENWKEKLVLNGFYKEFGEFLKTEESEADTDFQKKQMEIKKSV